MMIYSKLRSDNRHKFAKNDDFTTTVGEPVYSIPAMFPGNFQVFLFHFWIKTSSELILNVKLDKFITLSI